MRAITARLLPEVDIDAIVPVTPRRCRRCADVDRRPPAARIPWSGAIASGSRRPGSRAPGSRWAGSGQGAWVRVLFEDRALTAADGSFVDDFRGRDLYQRFDGGPMLGYGDAPVALHLYEIG